MITASRDGTARLWDVGTGKLLTTFVGHTGAIWNVTFSPATGARVATASLDGTARVFAVRGDDEVYRLAATGPDASSVAWSADGSELVAASGDGTISFFASGDGHLERQLHGPANTDPGSSYPEVRLGKRADVLADAFGGESVRLLSVADGSTRFVLPAQGAVEALAFSPDGSVLAAAGDDHMARLWSVASGALLTTLQHPAEVGGLAFGPDGDDLFTSDENGTIYGWHWRTGGPPRTFAAASRPIESLMVDASGTRILTGGSDPAPKIWRVRDGQLLVSLEGHTGEVARTAFDPTGALAATASLDGTTRVWDAGTGDLLAVFRLRSRSVVDLAFSPDGTRLATATRGDGAAVWDVSTAVPATAALGALLGCRDPYQLRAGRLVPRKLTRCPAAAK